jgi:hypothetical protein
MIRTLRLSFAVLALALSASSATARAQLSAYGMFTVDRMTGVSTSPILQTLSPLPCTGTTTINCTAYNDRVNPLGFTGGFFYDFKTLGPVTLGVDLRGGVASAKHGAQTYAEGSGAHIYSSLGGIRAAFRTPYKILGPYVQGSVGYARSNFGVLTDAVHSGTTYPANPLYPGTPTQNGIEYQGTAGLDLHFLPYADWRVAELNFGAIQTSGNYSHSYPLYSVSTGVVFHFSPRP